MKHNKDGIYICTKCGFTVNPNTPDGAIAFGLLGVAMRGTSRDVMEAETKRQIDTIEVEKVFVDEAELCQSCQNFLTRRMQAMRNNELKNKKLGGKAEPVGKLSKKEVNLLGKQKISKDEIQAIQQDINRKINAEYQEKMKKEAEAKKMAELTKKAEEEAKKKVAEEIVKAT